MRLTHRIVVQLAACALVVAACSGGNGDGGEGTDGTPDGGNGQAGSAAEVYAEFNAMSGQERLDALVAAAQAEGSLTVYATDTIRDVVAPAFEEEYGIPVNIYSAGSQEIMSRATREFEADRHDVDIIELPAMNLAQLERMGALGVYESPLRDALPDAAKGATWSAAETVAYVAGINTDLVAPGDAPTTWAELADPSWEGQVVLEPRDFDWFQAVWNYYVTEEGMSEEDVTSMFEALASNSRLVQGHTASADALLAGGTAFTLSHANIVDRLTATGAPVTWRDVDAGYEAIEPVVVRYTGVGTAANAPHPAAALLFMDYYLDPDNLVTFFAESKGIVATLTGQDSPLDGVLTVPVDNEELEANGNEWQDLYESILRNAAG